MAFSPTINWNWKFNFQRNLNDRAVEELAMLMWGIENISIDELEEDEETKAGSLRNILACHILRCCAMMILLQSFHPSK